MSMKYLGEEFDIHTGGVDHVPVHHTNEIAQSECVTGKPLAHFWIHNAFVNMEQEKMAKSEGNAITCMALSEHGITPLSYRYWLLTAHYRSPITFNWQALLGAQNALVRLHNAVSRLGASEGTVISAYRERFHKLINDDINTPQAVALAWELIKDEDMDSADKRATLMDMDRVLGLSLDNPSEELQTLLASEEVPLEKLPYEIKELIGERERARAEKDWKRSDALRDDIRTHGFDIKDTDGGPRITPL